jgi:hypothetical protein
LILGTEDRSGISNHYYITDRAFTIKQGGIINVEYGVKQNDSYLSDGLEPVTVEFAGGTSTDVIKFGTLPNINNLTTQSYSVWLYVDSFPAGPPALADAILNKYSYPGGFVLELYDGRVAFIKAFSSTSGWWQTNTSPFSTGQWAHVVVTYDATSTANDPVIYINGSSVTVNEIATPAGTSLEQPSAVLDIGNQVNPLTGLYQGALDGKIFDARIYNRILTAAEVTTLYNAGVPDHTIVTDGLVFQGPAVYADQGTAASLAGTVLSSTDHLVENIIRAVGIPNGSPTLRANP